MSIVVTEDRGPVRHIVMNRPEKRNAMNDELIAGIAGAVHGAAHDPSVLCVVVRGEGTMFSSGMDFSSLGALAGEPGRLREFRTTVLSAWNLCEEMTKPTIAQIHGACIGGAMELALACDLRTMAAELDAATDALVAELLACAPVAVGLAKRVIDASAKPALASTLEQEVTIQQICAESADFAEGARAFAEKRQPEFSGH